MHCISGRFILRLLLGLLLGVASGCADDGPAIVVVVSLLNEEAAAIQILMVLNGAVSQEVQEIDVSDFAGKHEVSFAGVLPQGAEGSVVVWVAARSREGCVFAVGNSEETKLRAADLQATVRISLTQQPRLLRDSTCMGKTPLLLGARLSEAVLYSVDKGTKTTSRSWEAIIQGWGLKPSARVFLEGAEVGPVKWISPTAVSVPVPPRPALAGRPELLEVSVQNPDGPRDRRAGLLTYVQPVGYFDSARGYGGPVGSSGYTPDIKLMDVNGN